MIDFSLFHAAGFPGLLRGLRCSSGKLLVERSVKQKSKHQVSLDIMETAEPERQAYGFGRSNIASGPGIKASKKVIPNGMANYPVRLAGKG